VIAKKPCIKNAETRANWALFDLADENGT